MDVTPLPEAAFVAPDGGNRDAVASLFDAAIARLLDVMTTAGARPPLPAAAAVIPADPPAAPQPETAILDALTGVLNASMNPGAPGWMGHMDPPPATASILGDLAAAAVNNNMLSLEMAPALSQLEVALMAAVAGHFGLPEGAGGVMTGGGSLANLLALAVARNRAFPDVAETGLLGLDRKPVLFASSAAHSSVDKAAGILGLGRSAVIKVETEGGRMRPDALAAAIATAREAGRQPFAVVATAGTTVTGSLDPLPAIADVAAAEDLWLHVDAAYGGALAYSPRYRGRLRGIERADSITFNPQKWLYVAKTCACCLFRDAREPERHFRTPAPYMAETGGFTNLGELGPQGTRHADVLKLWLTFQHLGLSGLARLIDDGMAMTGEILAEIDRRPGLELAARPDSNLLCFRPAVADVDDGDRLSAALQRRLLEAGIFASLPHYGGRRWLRLVLINPSTGAGEVARLFDVIDAGLSAPGQLDSAPGKA